ncbi:alpha/beta fold hydrolase [Brachybacterium sp. EF45031]|nr:alpha/beta fold hydrolase [Brachybacterium sillae]
MTVLREVVDGERDLFPLRYARMMSRHHRPSGAVPVLVLPDGPGIASVLPYDVVRRQLAAHGVDVLMMEHRGVGLSRLDARGDDLPARALRLDHVLGDITAVLDHARVPQVALYGVGYGALLAQAFAARHPQRVRALVLDSPMSGPDDEAVSQRAVRQQYWEGDQGLAPLLRTLDEDGSIAASEAGPVIMAVHEVGGPDAVRDLVNLLAGGRGLVAYQGVRDVLARRWFDAAPYLNERDLLAPIAVGQLGMGRHADGGPLDPLVNAGHDACRAHEEGVRFEGLPWEAATLSAQVLAPTLVLTGAQDLLTPPQIARDLARLLPRAALVEVPGAGHSMLDSHSRIAQVAIRWAAVGAVRELADRAEDLAQLPEAPLSQVLSAGVRLALAAERLSPWALRLQRARLHRLEQRRSPTSRSSRRVTVR